VGIKDEAAIKAKGLRSAAFHAQSRTADLDQIAALIDSGDVVPVISQILPLKDAAEAHRIIENGHTRGKIVLTVRE
jgi:NADPH:quinone reductase-like Zn-dependent oxidoreductase